MPTSVRRHLVIAVLSATVAGSATGSAADSVETAFEADSVETAFEADSIEVSVSDADLVFVTALGSASFLDSVLVSIRSFSADAGVAALALVGVGIRGGEGTHTIHTRIGEVMAGMDTMTPGRTVQT